MDISSSASKHTQSTDVLLSLRSLPQQLQDQVSLSSHELEGQFTRLNAECHAHDIEQRSPKSSPRLNHVREGKSFFGKTPLRQVVNGTSFDASFSQYDDAATFGFVLHEESTKSRTNGHARQGSVIRKSQDQFVVPPHIPLPDTLPSQINLRQWPEEMLNNVISESNVPPASASVLPTEDRRSTQSSIQSNLENTGSVQSSCSSERSRGSRLVSQSSFGSSRDDNASESTDPVDNEVDNNEYPTQREVHRRVVDNYRRRVHAGKTTVSLLVDRVETCLRNEELLTRDGQLQQSSVYSSYPELVTSGQVFDNLFCGDYPQVLDSGKVLKEQLVQNLDLLSKDTLDWEYRCDLLDLKKPTEPISLKGNNLNKDPLPETPAGLSVSAPMGYDSSASVVDRDHDQFSVSPREQLLCDRDVEQLIRDTMDKFLSTRAIELQQMLLKHACGVQQQQNVLLQRALEHRQMRLMTLKDTIIAQKTCGLEEQLELVLQDTWLALKTETQHPLLLTLPVDQETDLTEDLPIDTDLDALVQMLGEAVQLDASSALHESVVDKNVFKIPDKMKRGLEIEIERVAIFPRVAHSIEEVEACTQRYGVHSDIKLYSMPSEGVSTGFEEVLALFPDSVEESISTPTLNVEQEASSQLFCGALLEQHLQWPEKAEVARDSYQWLKSSAELGETLQHLPLSELSGLLLRYMQTDLELPTSHTVPEERQYDRGVTHLRKTDLLANSLGRVHAFLLVNGALPDNRTVSLELRQQTSKLNDLTGETVLLHETETAKRFEGELTAMYSSQLKTMQSNIGSLLDTENSLSSALKSMCLSMRQTGVIGANTQQDELQQQLVNQESDPRLKAWRQTALERRRRDVRETGPQHGVSVSSTGVAGAVLYPKTCFAGTYDRMIVTDNRVLVLNGNTPVTYKCAVDRTRRMLDGNISGMSEYVSYVDKCNAKTKSCSTPSIDCQCQRCERAVWEKHMARGSEHLLYDLVCHNTSVLNVGLHLHQSVKGFSRDAGETRAPAPIHTPAVVLQFPSWVPILPLESDVIPQVTIALPGEQHTRLVLPAVTEASPLLVTASVYHILQHHGLTQAEEDPQYATFVSKNSVGASQLLTQETGGDLHDVLGSVLSLSSSQVRLLTVDVNSYGTNLDFSSNYQSKSGLTLKGQFTLKDLRTPLNKMAASIDALYETETETSLTGQSALFYVLHTYGFSPLEVVLLYWLLQSAQNGIDPIEGSVQGGMLQLETRKHTLQLVQALGLLTAQCNNSALQQTLLQSSCSLVRAQGLKFDSLVQQPSCAKKEVTDRIQATMRWMGYSPDHPLPVRQLPASAAPANQPLCLQQMKNRSNDFSCVVKTSPFVEYLLALKTRQCMKDTLLSWMQGMGMACSFERLGNFKSAVYFDHFCPPPVQYGSYLGCLPCNTAPCTQYNAEYFGSYEVESTLLPSAHLAKHPWLLQPMSAKSKKAHMSDNSVNEDHHHTTTTPVTTMDARNETSPSASYTIVEDGLVINTMRLFNDTQSTLRTEIAEKVYADQDLEKIAVELAQPLQPSNEDTMLEQLSGKLPVQVTNYTLPYDLGSSKDMSASTYARGLIMEGEDDDAPISKPVISPLTHIQSNSAEVHPHADALGHLMTAIEAGMKQSDATADLKPAHISLDPYELSDCFKLWSCTNGVQIPEHHQGIPFTLVEDILSACSHALPDKIELDDFRDGSAASALRTMLHTLFHEQTYGGESQQKRLAGLSVKLNLVTSTRQPDNVSALMEAMSSRYLAFPSLYALLCAVQMDKTEPLNRSHVEHLLSFFPPRTALPQTLSQHSWQRSRSLLEPPVGTDVSLYSRLNEVFESSVVKTLMVRRNAVPLRVSSIYGDLFFAKSMFYRSAYGYLRGYVNKYQVALHKLQFLMLNQQSGSILQKQSLFEADMNVLDDEISVHAIDMTQTNTAASFKALQGHRNQINMYHNETTPPLSRQSSVEASGSARNSENSTSNVNIIITGDNTNSVFVHGSHRPTHNTRAQPVSSTMLQAQYTHPLLTRSDYLFQRAGLISHASADTATYVRPETLALRPLKGLHDPLVCVFWILTYYHDILSECAETLLQQTLTRTLAQTVSALSTGMSTTRSSHVTKSNFVSLANTYVRAPTLNEGASLVDLLYFAVGHVRNPQIAIRLCKYPFFKYTVAEENAGLLNICELLRYDYDDLLVHLNSLPQVESLIVAQQSSDIPVTHDSSFTRDLFGASVHMQTNGNNSTSNIVDNNVSNSKLNNKRTNQLRPSKNLDRDIELIPVAFQHPIPPLHSTIPIMEVNSKHLLDCTSPLTAQRLASAFQKEFNILSGSVFQYHAVQLRMRDSSSDVHLPTQDATITSEALRSIGRSVEQMNEAMLQSLGLEQCRVDVSQELENVEQRMVSRFSHANLSQVEQATPIVSADDSWFSRVFLARYLAQEVSSVQPVHVNELSAVTMVHTGYLAASAWNNYSETTRRCNQQMSPSLALVAMRKSTRMHAGYFHNYAALYQEYVAKHNCQLRTLDKPMLLLDEQIEVVCTPVLPARWESVLPAQKPSADNAAKSITASPQKESYTLWTLGSEESLPTEGPLLRRLAPPLVTELPSLGFLGGGVLETVDELEKQRTATASSGSRTPSPEIRGRRLKSRGSRGRHSRHSSPASGQFPGLAFLSQPCKCFLLVCTCDLSHSSPVHDAEYLNSRDHSSFQVLTSTARQRMSMLSHCVPLDLLRHLAYVSPNDAVMRALDIEYQSRQALQEIGENIQYTTTVVQPKDMKQFYEAIPISQRVSRSVSFLNLFVNPAVVANNSLYKICQQYTVNVLTQLEYPRVPNRRISALLLIQQATQIPASRLYTLLHENSLHLSAVTNNTPIDTISAVENIRVGFSRLMLHFSQIVTALNLRVNSLSLQNELVACSHMLNTAVLNANEAVLNNLEQRTKKNIQPQTNLNSAITSIREHAMNSHNIVKKAVGSLLANMQPLLLPSSHTPVRDSIESVLTALLTQTCRGTVCSIDYKKAYHAIGQLGFLHKHQKKLKLPHTLESWNHVNTKPLFIPSRFLPPSIQDIPVTQGNVRDGVSQLIPPSQLIAWKDAVASEEFKKILVILLNKMDTVLYDQNNTHAYNQYVSGETILPLPSRVGNNVSLSKLQKLTAELTFAENATSLGSVVIDSISSVASQPMLERSLSVKSTVVDYIFENLRNVLLGSDIIPNEQYGKDVSMETLHQGLGSVLGLKRVIIQTQLLLHDIPISPMPAFSNITSCYVASYSALLPCFATAHMHSQRLAGLSEFVQTSLYAQFTRTRLDTLRALESIPRLLVEDFVRRKLTSEVMDAQSRPPSQYTTTRRSDVLGDVPSILSAALQLGLFPQLFFLLKSVLAMEAWYYNPCISASTSTVSEKNLKDAFTPRRLASLPISPHHSRTLFHVMERLNASGNVQEFASVLIQVFFNVYQSEPSHAVLLELTDQSAGEGTQTQFSEMLNSAWFTQQTAALLGSHDDSWDTPKRLFWQEVYPSCMAFVHNIGGDRMNAQDPDLVVQEYALRHGIQLNSTGGDGIIPSLFYASKPDIATLHSLPMIPSLLGASMEVFMTLPAALDPQIGHARGIANHYLSVLQQTIRDMQIIQKTKDVHLTRILGALSQHWMLLSKISNAHNSLPNIAISAPLHLWQYSCAVQNSRELMTACQQLLARQGLNQQLSERQADSHARLKQVSTGVTPRNAALSVVAQLLRDTSILSVQSDVASSESWLLLLLESTHLDLPAEEQRRRSTWASNRICLDLIVNAITTLAADPNANSLLSSTTALAIDTKKAGLYETDSSAPIAGLHAHVVNSSAFLGANIERASVVDGRTYYVLHSGTFERLMKRFTARLSMDLSAIDPTTCALGRVLLDHLVFAQNHTTEAPAPCIPTVDVTEQLQQVLGEVYILEDTPVGGQVVVTKLPSLEERTSAMTIPYDQLVAVYSHTNVKTLEEVLILQTVNSQQEKGSPDSLFTASRVSLDVSLPVPIRHAYTALQFHQYSLQMNQQLALNGRQYMQKHRHLSVLVHAIYQQLQSAYSGVDQAHRNRVVLHHIQTLAQSNKMWLELNNRLVIAQWRSVQLRARQYAVLDKRSIQHVLPEDDSVSKTPQRDILSLLLYNKAFSKADLELRQLNTHRRYSTDNQPVATLYRVLQGGESDNHRWRLAGLYEGQQSNDKESAISQYSVQRKFWKQLRVGHEAQHCTELVDAIPLRSNLCLLRFKKLLPVYLQTKANQRIRARDLLVLAQRLKSNQALAAQKEKLVSEQADDIAKVGRFVQAARALGHYDQPELDHRIQVLRGNIVEPVKRTLTLRKAGQKTEVSEPDQVVRAKHIQRVDTRKSTQNIFEASMRVFNAPPVSLAKLDRLSTLGTSQVLVSGTNNSTESSNIGTKTTNITTDPATATTTTSSTKSINRTRTTLVRPDKSTQQQLTTSASIQDLPFYLTGTNMQVLPTIQRNKTKQQHQP